MSAIKLRRIIAAVATEAREEEIPDTVDEVSDLDAVDELLQREAVEGPASWMGQDPLSRSLELWREARELQRLVFL